MNDSNSPVPSATWQESGLRWWWISLILIALDQLTKAWIVSSVTEDIYVLPVLNIIHTVNFGAAWSMFDDLGGVQRWILSALAVAVSIGIIVWMRKLHFASQKLLIGGLTLILGGAIGNVIDRLRLGHVVDFVQVHWGNSYFPAFNVADMCISVGAACVILDSVLEHRREKRAAAAGGAQEQ